MAYTYRVTTSLKNFKENKEFYDALLAQDGIVSLTIEDQGADLEPEKADLAPYEGAISSAIDAGYTICLPPGVVE